MNLPNPIPSTEWITLATNVFNLQVARWDKLTCDGGLRWQIFTFNNGYNYKNTQTNANFFLLAARLAQLTGNATYATWAETAYNWTESVGLVTDNYYVFDGTDVATDCAQINHIQWTSGLGTFLYGSAIMYNLTNAAPLWTARVTGFANATQLFSSRKGAEGILYEAACEPNNKCNSDQLAFKGQLASAMARTTLAAPFTSKKLMSILQTSAKAAANACTDVGCQARWYEGGADDAGPGLGQMLSALSVVQGLLVKEVTAKGGNLTAGGQNIETTTPSSTVSATGTAAPSAIGTGMAAHLGAGWSWVGLLGLMASAIQAL
jgi:mannan endo-1,6-alpha-mannosidase